MNLLLISDYITMTEKSCIPFNTISLKVRQGAGFGETLTQVKKVTVSLKNDVFDRAYLDTLPVKNRLIHNLAYTVIGLMLVVGYEYIRLNHPELKLPSLEPIIPAASITPGTSTKVDSGEGVTAHDVEMISRLSELRNLPGVDSEALAKRIAEMENKNLEERKKRKK